MDLVVVILVYDLPYDLIEVWSGKITMKIQMLSNRDSQSKFDLTFKVFYDTLSLRVIRTTGHKFYAN